MSAAARAVTLDVNILGRDYKVACRESERAELAEAVAYLDGQMREIRNTGKVTGADRIAVMAALNIAHELLRERRQAPAAASKRKIQAMGSAIDELLGSQEKLF
jgi:cell division protein ZapA